MSKARSPSYGAATRLARLVHGLHQRPLGWSFDAIRDELRISERTLLRYLRLFRTELLDERERPLCEVVRRGGRRFLRLRADRPVPSVDGNPYELLYLYFALSVFQFLEGTVIKESIDSFWSRLLAKVEPPVRVYLRDFQKKFYVVPHLVKEYRNADDVLDTITQALLYERRLRLRHRRLDGQEKDHEVDPYSLIMYRGGLYLIGRNHRPDEIRYFAVERILRAEKLERRFAYPRTYSPQRYIEGIFGIFSGPETEVELLVRNRETATLLESRRIHPTQRFRHHPDGTATLTMTVRGTTELVPWILGFGNYVEVRRPAALRREVRDTLAAAAELYTPRRRPRGRAAK